MDTNEFFRDKGWDVVGSFEIPGKPAKYFYHSDLGLSSEASKYLKQKFPQGLYGHQRAAIQAFKNNENLCLTTSTASGKSAVFYVSAIETLYHDPSARILAIYPLKALGKEQEARWQQALDYADLSAKTGRIDGQVPVSSRLDILKSSQVVVVTPDILHAWLMNNLSQKRVLDFISHLSLMIIDEIHNYTGVFGSNSAFLFRRIQHVQRIIGKRCRYICASATISSPELHANKLLGISCKLIDKSSDTSPKGTLRIRLVRAPKSKDILTNISEFLIVVSRDPSNHFIAFVDSRKQTEYVASIVARGQQKELDENFMVLFHFVWGRVI